MNTSDAFFRSVEFAELTLRVADIARVGAFYESELGFHRVSGGAHEARFSPTGAEPALIALEHAPSAVARPRGAAGLFHVAFLYPNRAALSRIFTRLVANGFRLGAADHGVSEALYLSDPEGNGLELYADRRSPDGPPDAHRAPSPVGVEARSCRGVLPRRPRVSRASARLSRRPLLR